MQDRPQLRAYLDSLKPEAIKALKLAAPDAYLAVLKGIVNELFPDGADIRFRTEDGVYDYGHLLTDVTRQDYISSLPRTLKNTDITVEFTTPEGADKAYLIKKFSDPDIQKDVWDMLVILDGELKTKIARKGAVGRRYIESQMIGAGKEAPPSTTPPGNIEDAPTQNRSTDITISTEQARVNTHK